MKKLRYISLYINVIEAHSRFWACILNLKQDIYVKNKRFLNSPVININMILT